MVYIGHEMDRKAGHKTAAQYLFPPIEPFDQRMLDVGDGHRIYVEQCGNPSGRPVVVLHGGPGGGCSPAMRRYFDPEIYRIILFDQRGCGKSRPHASVDHNTTWDLVADIERIRTLFGIERWIVFGGSWGATLGLVYAENHPDVVEHLVLRGVFTMTKPELDWFYGGGAGAFWPENWQRFTHALPYAERNDIIAGFAKRLFSGDHATEIRFSRAWLAWENALASIESDGSDSVVPSEYARAFARLGVHYFINQGFLDDPNYILNNADRLASIPGTIVQGRYDMVCPPKAAFDLHQRWPASDLVMVPMAGHALSEHRITAELIRTMQRIAWNA